MSKKLFSAALAVGLFSATVAVQAATIEYSNDSTRFFFSNVTDVWTGSFVVNNAFDNSGVTLFTDSFNPDFAVNPDNSSFDPFLVVWDSLGNKVAFNDDISGANWNSFLNLGVMADGFYTFTIGNSPNAPLGNNFSDGFGVPSGFDLTMLYPNKANGEWHVVVTGVVPEPETWAMLLAGLAIVGSVARRRKHA
jgi:hypothetical protein